MRILYEVGDEVRVIGRCDESMCQVEYIGLRGVVTGVHSLGDNGETPENPMYVVTFTRLFRKLKFHNDNGFWGEELKPVRAAKK